MLYRFIIPGSIIQALEPESEIICSISAMGKSSIMGTLTIPAVITAINEMAQLGEAGPSIETRSPFFSPD